MKRMFITAAFCLAAIISALAQQEERLTLQQAVATALEHNPEHKAALADIHAAQAGFQIARSFYFPRLTSSEAATRSNDPVYVFGTRLRQTRFTAADFALNRLNNPQPIGNFATRFSANWNIFDSFSTRFNTRRAAELRNAASEQLARADQVIVFHAIQAYYAALFARRQLELTEYAVKTAQAVAEQSHTRVAAGMTIESDYLAAQVDLASRQQEMVRARNALELSTAELNVAMGVAAGHPYVIEGELAERPLPAASLQEAEANALHQRSDLKAISASLQAGDAGVKAARSAFGPRINVFAASELDNVSPFGNGGNSWTAGAELQLDLFSGGEKSATVSRARAQVERMQASKQTAEGQVHLEVRRAWYDYDSAGRMLEVTKAAITQAEEGLRIVSNRYEAGMTTITDLLRAEDAARVARTNYWEAIYRYFVSYAAFELATGSLNSHSLVVTP